MSREKEGKEKKGEGKFTKWMDEKCGTASSSIPEKKKRKKGAK